MLDCTLARGHCLLSLPLLEHDADQVEATRRFGWQVYYGDATRLDLLRVAGAGRAKVLVVAIAGPEAYKKVYGGKDKAFAAGPEMANANMKCCTRSIRSSSSTE